MEASSLPAAILTVLAGLYILSVIAWGHGEYWSVYDSRARFKPGTGMFHSLFYTADHKPKFSRGVKSEPAVTAEN